MPKREPFQFLMERKNTGKQQSQIFCRSLFKIRQSVSSECVDTGQFFISSVNCYSFVMERIVELYGVCPETGEYRSFYYIPKCFKSQKFPFNFYIRNFSVFEKSVRFDNYKSHGIFTVDKFFYNYYQFIMIQLLDTHHQSFFLLQTVSYCWLIAWLSVVAEGHINWIIWDAFLIMKWTYCSEWNVIPINFFLTSSIFLCKNFCNIWRANHRNDTKTCEILSKKLLHCCKVANWMLYSHNTNFLSYINNSP